MLHLAANSTVVVIGPPGSGKTTVGRLLADDSGLPLYSTDTYLGAGHVEALYAIMQEIGDEGWIVEGMIGYRLLRKRKQLRMPAPDIVIELDATDAEIKQAYADSGRRCNLPAIRKFCKAHDSVMEDYLLMDGEMPRVWVYARSRHIRHLIGGGPSGTASSDSSM